MHSSSLTQFFVLFAMFLVLAAPSAAQYQDRALERARSVKMLSDDREAVRKIFYDFNLDDSDETSDEFSFGDTQIEVTYSSGTCDEEEEEEEVWSIPAGRVVKVLISEYGEWKLKDLKIDLSALTKESRFLNSEASFIYHAKKDGLVVEVSGDEVENVLMFPSVDSTAKRCNSNFAKEFFAEKSWFGRKGPPSGYVCEMKPASVTELELSHTEISAITQKQVEITATAFDPENDPLVYVYNVSVGKIIGTGAKVKWDLSGVRSGTYMITAGVDDGCGLCGATMTKTVAVK